MTIASVSAAGSLPSSAPISVQQLIEPLTQLVRSIEQLVAVLQQQAPAGVPATPATDAATAGGGASDPAAATGGGGGCGCGGGMQASAGADALGSAPNSRGANAAPTAAPAAHTKKSKRRGSKDTPSPSPSPSGGSTAQNAPAAPTSGTPVDAGLKRRNPRSVAEMMDWVRKEVNDPHEDYYRRCGHFAGAAFGWKASGEQYAIDQWRNASSELKHAGDTNPPAGALVFWETGSRAGHVAVSMGNGMVASNDIRRKGKIDIVPLSEITREWGAKYQGWTPPYFPKAA
jgi:hypothetical protein